MSYRLKFLEEQVHVLTSKKELEEVKQRLYDVEGIHDDLEQYTRKFNLVVHRIPELEEEDCVENIINLGKIQKFNLQCGDVDIVHRLNTKKLNQNTTNYCPFQKANFTKPG